MFKVQGGRHGGGHGGLIWWNFESYLFVQFFCLGMLQFSERVGHGGLKSKGDILRLAENV